MNEYINSDGSTTTVPKGISQTVEIGSGTKACRGCSHYYEDYELDNAACCDLVKGYVLPHPETQFCSKFVRCGEETIGDVVNHPKHYETGKFECIDVMIETQGEAAVKAFCLCNAFKYIYRHNAKNGVEDIRKAKWYIDKYLELEDNDELRCDQED